MDERRQEFSAMPMDRATAVAAAVHPVTGDAAGEAPPVTTESFRQLTARLRAAKAAPPPQDNVIPLRKAQPRQPEPAAEPIVPAAVQAAPAALPAMVPAAPPRDAGEDAGDTAISLLELMAATAGLLPQERALASDTLLLLLPRVPLRQLTRLAERVAIMDNPPPLLVERLIRDPRPEVMGPVLERSANVCDRDMMAAAAPSDLDRLRMIARRRVLSPVLSGHLVASGDPGVILALLRNAGAEIPHQCFAGLCALAAENPVLLAPLATRAELPPEVAFELYWSLPRELRRLMLSRFLTDSGTLGRILRIALAEDAHHSGQLQRGEWPVSAQAIVAALDGTPGGSVDEAARRLAPVAELAEGTVRRILSDRLGEPAAVLFKALGVSRSRFVEALARLRAAGLAEESDPQALQAVFDGLSFTKARMLVTYWDWHTRKAGPYAPGPLVETAALA